MKKGQREDTRRKGGQKREGQRRKGKKKGGGGEKGGGSEERRESEGEGISFAEYASTIRNGKERPPRPKQSGVRYISRCIIYAAVKQEGEEAAET